MMVGCGSHFLSKVKYTVVLWFGGKHTVILWENVLFKGGPCKSVYSSVNNSQMILGGNWHAHREKDGTNVLKY